MDSKEKELQSTITITLDEYKYLLTIRGKYEELSNLYKNDYSYKSKKCQGKHILNEDVL